MSGLGEGTENRELITPLFSTSSQPAGLHQQVPLLEVPIVRTIIVGGLYWLTLFWQATKPRQEFFRVSVPEICSPMVRDGFRFRRCEVPCFTAVLAQPTVRAEP